MELDFEAYICDNIKLTFKQYKIYAHELKHFPIFSAEG